MPLAGFIWGSRTASPRPRTRGEQVVIWVTQGTLQLDFPRTRHMLGAGNLFFIPSGTAFAALPLIDCQGQVLMIAPHLSRDLPRAFPERTTGGQIEPDDASLRQLLLDLATEAQHDTADAQAAIECHLALLALRLERLEPAAKPAQREPRNIPDIPLAERFAVLAENRLADGCAISDLAIELGVTTTELDAACRHKHGKRAIEVLHHLRFRRAAQMLRDTSESPARIARILGYTSLAHLSRSFVEATGRLPEQFRQTH